MVESGNPYFLYLSLAVRSIDGKKLQQPTWGLISTEGVGRFSTTCDTVGIFARALDDLTLLAKVYRLDFDYSPSLEQFGIQGSKIAFVKSPVWDEAGPGTRKAWDKARSLLAEAGAAIHDVDLPEPFHQCHKWRETIVAGEARSAFLSSKASSVIGFRRMLKRDMLLKGFDTNGEPIEFVQSRAKLHASLQALVQNEDEPSRRDMLEAYDGVARLRTQWDEIAHRYDAVITPSTVDEAPEGLWDTGSAVSVLEVVVQTTSRIRKRLYDLDSTAPFSMLPPHCHDQYHCRAP